MKKFFKIVTTLCLAFMLCFTVVGCGEKEEDKFYQQTSAKFDEFIEHICENDNYKNGIIYGTNVSNIFDNIGSDTTFNDPQYAERLSIFTQLKTVYDKIFINSFKFLEGFKGVFNVTDKSKITKETKKEYLAFEESLANATKSIDNFNDNIARLDSAIGGSTIEIALKNITENEVRKFKREYVALSEEIIDICNEFLHLCQTYIYPYYVTYTTESGFVSLTKTQIVNQRTIASLRTAVSTLTPAIKYLNSFDGQYHRFDNEYFFNALDNLLLFDFTNEDNVTVEELHSWNEIYKAYTNDIPNFYTALENIDMSELKKDFYYNVDDYLAEYPNKYAYVNKVFDFVENDVLYLYNALYELCN